MFDFGVYLGPAIVALGMLVAFVGFLVGGSSAIRESAEEAQQALSRDSAAGGDTETNISDITLPELSIISPDMEKTAEFSQPLDIVPTFSQSFLEGQEVAPGGGSADYNAAIDRIKADLEASDTEDNGDNAGNAEDDDLAIFEHGAEDFAAYGLYDGAYSDIDEDIIEAANVVEALQGSNVAKEASGQQEQTEAGDSVLDNVLNKEAENKAADVEENNEENNIEEKNDVSADNIENTPEAEENTAEGAGMDVAAIAQAEIEKTAIEKSAIEKSAMEETMILKYPKQPAGKAITAEVLDAAALEETRLHTDIAANTPSNEPNSVLAADLASLQDMSDDGILIPEAPIPFGSRMAWLAIPGFKPSEVIAMLRLGNVQSANWTLGLTQAYADNNQVFVSPSLGGWVLVIGKTLWQKADMNRSAENIPWLKDIARRFGNVCFFSTMKGLGNHGWIGIRDGQIARAYGYSGELEELIWFVGEPTEEEEIINPAFVDEVQERYQPGFRPVIPDEKLVLAMAAAWSVDTSFKKRQYPPDFGFLGTMD